MLLFFGQDLTLDGLYGNLAAILGGVALAVMIVGTRAQKDSHPARIFLIGSCLGGLIGLPSVLQETWSLEDAAIIAYLGIFQTGLAAALCSIAIRHVPALESNLILMQEPVLNPLWVFLVIGESPSPLAMVGGPVVLGAIAVRAIAAVRRTDLCRGDASGYRSGSASGPSPGTCRAGSWPTRERPCGWSRLQWKRLKCDDIHLKTYGSMSEVEKGLGAYFPRYNERRWHKTLTGRPQLWFTSAHYRRNRLRLEPKPGAVSH